MKSPSRRAPSRSRSRQTRSAKRSICPGAPSTGPARFGLALTPNPFALVLRVAVRPSGGRPVAAEVIDALGRHVRTIGLAGPGGGFLWDGRLDDGSRAPSGLYLVVARRMRRKEWSRLDPEERGLTRLHHEPYLPRARPPVKSE